MEFNVRPIMIQGSDEPIVIRRGAELPDLICFSCKNSTLVANYLSECFVGIGLQCFKCGNVTWTSSLPVGEVFPGRPVSLGKSGRYLVGSSVVNDEDVVLTCDQEIEMARMLTSPAADSKADLHISLENLDLLSAELNALSGGRFDKYLQSARRSLANGDVYFRENPLAWAVELLKKQLAENKIDMNKKTLVALGFVQSYNDILGKWKGHIHFPVLAQEICAYFYHSLMLLAVASYLHQHGNNVAINAVQSASGERSADLYIRLSGSKKLFIEVKGPQALEWTNRDVQVGRIKKSIEKSLSDSRGQIDLGKPGILVIGTTCLDDGFLAEFKESVTKVLKAKGRSYPAVAAICVFGLEEVNLEFGRISTLFDVSLINNQHYFEENPLSI